MALRFTPRAGGALAVTALAMAFLASACGGDDKDGGDEVFRPPSPSPTSSAQQDTDPGAQEGIEGARAALQAFLRGQAAATRRYAATSRRTATSLRASRSTATARPACATRRTSSGPRSGRPCGP
ncbi:hypothetical protein ACFQY7_53950 [Actinomadura luteofluorescens]|uniref:hypothetical protein n=1 Tax=Actinomadura luteofluorescens TaxID=46163 RepID=UPI0036429EB3